MNRKDFFVIISPDDRIIREIFLFKKACAKHIGVFPWLYSKAHISLVLSGEEIQNPRQPAFIHEQYFQVISHTVARIESIKLNIKGFNYFTHGTKSRTIYAELDISPKEADWFETLKKLLYAGGKLFPHITIAKTISFRNFDVLWPFFEKIDYKNSFVPKCLTVLTREIGNNQKNYKVLTELPFNNQLLEPVA